MQTSGRHEDEIAGVDTSEGRHPQQQTDDPVSAALTASHALDDVISRSVADILDIVSLPQYRAMVALAPQPLLRSELGARLGSGDARLEAIVTALADEGWVELREGGIIALSAHGVQLVAHVDARRSAELSGILEALPRADRRAVASAFTLFATAAATQDEAS
ncbi:MAG: hypothetical protein KF761_05305 [Salinibacterium sp.]|nr:hypothetical protein [Salinibacterium sp.]